MQDQDTKKATSALVALVAAERRRQGVTQLELADRAGVSAEAWKWAEQGRTTPSLPVLMAVVGALGARLEFFPRQD